MLLKELANYLNTLLDIESIPDNSQNGIQVENRSDIRKIGLAVDTSLASIQQAVDLECQMLFVHHGLFWGKPVELKGALYQRIKLLMDSDIALYAAHLPLDLHAELGNNAQVQQVLNWPVIGDFGDSHGTIIGKEIRLEASVFLGELVETFESRLGCQATVWPFGKKKIQTIGYVSGGALSMLEQAIDSGLDAYITGEPGHSFYWMAKEAGINVIFGGHYATETLGVKAVGKKLETDLSLETVFIDLPTGL